MKKILIVLISSIVTMIITFFGFRIVYDNLFVNNSYEVSTAIKMENNSGVMSNYKIECKDCTNGNDEVEIMFNVFGENERDVYYDLIIIVNYEQIEFVVDNNRDKHYTFNTNNSNKEFKVLIDKANFEYMNNDVIFILRQDTEEHVSDNDLMQDANSVCRRFNFVNENSNTEYSVGSVYDEYKEVCIEAEDDFAIISSESSKDFLINYNNSGINYIDLLFDLNGEYIVMGLCDSEVLQIENKKDYLCMELYKGQKTISVPYSMEKKEDLYELEFICIPIKEGVGIGEVLTSRRFTVKVE